MQLRLQLLASGRYLTVFPDSLVRYSADLWSLRVLPVALGQALPVVIVTLKNRTLTPRCVCSSTRCGQQQRRCADRV